MKNLADLLNEGILDMTDDDVFDKKSDVKPLRLMLSLKEHAHKGYDRDVIGRKLDNGDFVLFPEAKGISGVLPLGLGEVIKIGKMITIQTGIGRVNKWGYQCVKITKEDIEA